jgi:hypothetical protein
MAKDRELAALEAALEAAEGEMEEALAGAGSGGRVRL